MQITIDLPDNLPLTEADVRIELAIVLDRQHSLRLDKAAQLVSVISVEHHHKVHQGLVVELVVPNYR